MERKHDLTPRHYALGEIADDQMAFAVVMAH